MTGFLWHTTWAFLAAGCLVVGGCSRSNPVEPISVDASGVELRDQPLEIDPSDWAGWRGPHRNGVAREQPIVTQWDDQTNILWSADVPGRGHSSPVVVGDRILLTTALEEEQQQLVLCFDRQTGESLWSTQVHAGGFTDRDLVHPKSSDANSTVACDGRYVFASFLNGDHVYLTSLDLDGQIRWQCDVGPFRSTFGYAPSPLLYRSAVIVAADQVGGGYLAAVDRDTGKIVWRTRRPAIKSYSSPTIAQVSGRTQLLVCGCNQVASFDPDTGTQRWSCPGTTESTCGTMVADDQCVYASGGYPDHETLCVRGDGSGEVVWRNRTSVYEPSLLLAGTLLFAVTDKGIVHCWDAATGKLRWRQRLSGSFSASPVLCNDLILVPNLKGEVYVFQAAGDAYREVARNKVGDDCYASLAIHQGQILARAGMRAGQQRSERLICIGKAPAAP